MDRVIKTPLVALSGDFALLLGLASPLSATAAGAVTLQFGLAHAMAPPTGMMDAQHPMPMNRRYLKRLPQPVRVGDLIGLPVLDLNASTLGYVGQVVRTPRGKETTLSRCGQMPPYASRWPAAKRGGSALFAMPPKRRFWHVLTELIPLP